jgi:hypothetical protein
MGRLILDYKVNISARPEDVFTYVADLTKHSEWSDGLHVESVGGGPVAVGSEYRSTGKQLGKEVENSVRITLYEPSTRLSFSASDGKTEFMNEIRVSAIGSSTLLERRVSFDANPVLGLMFRILIGPLVANPSMNKSLKKLKANMENTAAV